MEHLEIFESKLSESLSDGTFVKLTLSKPAKHNAEFRNTYARKIEVKGKPMLSFTYRFETNDQTKNLNIEQGILEVKSLVQDSFRVATLMTTAGDCSLMISKKGKSTLQEKGATHTSVPDGSHDKAKMRRTRHSDQYLFELGITDKEGEVIPKMADKFRQINKYLEIVEGLLKNAPDVPDDPMVVDMGSGKGYLTFALYDFLKNKQGMSPRVIGIELRQELVDYCNGVAHDCGFDDLSFGCQRIEEFEGTNIDILIALHACDTATDDAISKGVVANAGLIICAPCCHKFVRQQVKGIEQTNPLLKYGIFKERQFEMVTDTLRALLLERKEYDTKIFEFISNEHTRKNVMLVGTKTSKPVNQELLDSKITELKSEFGLDEYYLEKLLR